MRITSESFISRFTLGYAVTYPSPHTGRTKVVLDQNYCVMRFCWPVDAIRMARLFEGGRAILFRNVPDAMGIDRVPERLL